MKTTSPNKNAPRTHQQLADALGVSRQAITAAAQKSDAPKIGDVAAWKTYIAANGRSGSLPLDLRRKIGEARLAILKQQEIAAIRENQTKAGQMMLTADAEREAAEAMGLTFAELERMAREIPPAIAGQDSITVFKRISAEIERIRKELKEKFQSIGKP